MSSSCRKNPEECTDLSEEYYDCNGNCIVDYDCAGECGGNAELDNCGACDADSTNDCIPDCTGEWGGSAEIDNCGICCGGITEIQCISNGNCPECQDGEEYDCNGICNGNENLDCNDVCGGTAILDDCNQCVEGTTNEITIVDTSSVWEGENCHYYDCKSGQCLNNWAMDCAGVCFGQSTIDGYGNCVGGGLENGSSWQIAIEAKLNISSNSYLIDTLVIGVSEDATNHYDSEYDLPSNIASPGTYMLFYSRNKENPNDPLNPLCCNSMIDIHGDDYSKYNCEGLIWISKIETSLYSVDSLILSFSFDEIGSELSNFNADIMINEEKYIMDVHKQIKLNLDILSENLDSIKIIINELYFD